MIAALTLTRRFQAALRRSLRRIRPSLSLFTLLILFPTLAFLGNDAITRTANNASFTVLSLATKSSYKDKKTGEYNGHTEWHRCIVWGRL